MTELHLRVIAAAVGLAWTASLLAGPGLEVGPFVFDDLAAAGGIGAALLVLAAPPSRRTWLAGPIVVVAPLLGGLRPDGWTPAAVLLVGAAWVRLWTSSDMAAAVPVLAAGVYLLRTGPAGLDGPVPIVFAVTAAGVAVGACLLRSAWSGGVGAGLAVGLLGMAAACLDRPFGPTAGALLLAAAVVTVALDRPVAAVSALPGAVTAVAGLLEATARPGAVAALAALGTLAAIAIAVAAARPSGPPAWTVGRWLTVALGLWLLLAPTTWGWARPAALDPYQEGVVVAAAAGAVVVLAVAAMRIRQTRW